MMHKHIPAPAFVSTVGVSAAIAPAASSASSAASASAAILFIIIAYASKAHAGMIFCLHYTIAAPSGQARRQIMTNCSQMARPACKKADPVSRICRIVLLMPCALRARAPAR